MAQDRNAGDLAHSALNIWIRDGLWVDDKGERLVELYDLAAEHAGANVNELHRGRATRSRLRVKASAIRAAILAVGVPSEIFTELTLYDKSRNFSGRLDVLIRGPHSDRVLDLKTNSVSGVGGAVPPDVTFQLLFYAALSWHHFGHLPRSVEVFSLVDGHRTYEVSEAAVQDVLTQVETAQFAYAAGDRQARPSDQACTYCPRRLTCDPHWLEPRTAGAADSVEGLVLRTVRSERGLVSLLLATAHGEVWVNALPAITAPDALPGRRLRVAHVFRSSESEGDRSGRASFHSTASTTYILD